MFQRFRLNPTHCFWLLQWAVVPCLALMGACYVASAHAGDFSSKPYAAPPTSAPFAFDKYTPAPEASYMPKASVAYPAVEMPVYKVHFSHYEFPTRLLWTNPSDPVKETQFQHFLHEATLAYEHLEMTNHLEHAQYRVEVECAGLLACSSLQLNIFDMHRNFLSSVQIPRTHLNASEANLRHDAQHIVSAVNKRIMAFPNGGFGTYKQP